MVSGGQRWGEVLASIRYLRSEQPLERRWWDAQEELLVGLIRRLETEETEEEILDQALEGLVRCTPLAREVRLLEEADIWPLPSRRVQRPTLEQYLAGTLPPSRRPQERELPLPPDPRTPRNRMDLLRDLAQGRQPYRVLKKELPPQEAVRIQACLHLLLQLLEERQ